MAAAVVVHNAKMTWTRAQGCLCSFSKPLNHLYSSSVRDVASHGGDTYDLVVVGGGIIGVACARELSIRYPHKTIAIVEKEQKLGYHQTGHNSGVIHSGIYYTPGTLKAKLCVRGADLLYQYCDKFGVPYKRVGKVIVAVEEREISKLNDLYERGLKNNVKDLKLIGPSELKEIEPHCQGLKAIHSPYTGIVDYGQVTQSYAEDFKNRNGNIYTGFNVSKFEFKGSDGNNQLVEVQSNDKPSVFARQVLTCAGLYSDRISKLSGGTHEPRIVPFRGEYLVLKSDKSYLARGNIYPVPDPRFPFLGVHFTPRMDGSVWLGPNAILAFAREGYNFTDVNIKDFREALSFTGLQKLMMKYWKFGSMELFRRTFLVAQWRQLKKYVPEIQPEDIMRGPAGVRAQAMDIDGNLIEDFIFDEGSGDFVGKMLHVRNAPSPGATSSLAIAEMIADKTRETFDWN